MIIKKAYANHLNAIFDLLQRVAAHMKAQEIEQWNINYPTLEHVKSDIAVENLHALFINEEIAGVISIDDNQSPAYINIPWKYNNGKILVVHRLAVSPNFQKRGLGKQLMDYALTYALEHNYSSIRLDAYSQNERTLNFYKNRNYEFRGEIYFPYRDQPFYCFEKSLK